MNALITLLVVGLLVLALVSVVTLVWAVRHAVPGYEDENGFNPSAAPQLPARRPVEGSENPWDYVPGAYCKLDVHRTVSTLGGQGQPGSGYWQ